MDKTENQAAFMLKLLLLAYRFIPISQHLHIKAAYAIHKAAFVSLPSSLILL